MHIRSHETHSGADVLFSNSAHFSAHHNFEFNLHLTSTNIFLTALYPGDQGHSVCFLAPSALKPFPLMFCEIESVQRFIQMTCCLTRCLFSLSSIAFPPPPSFTLFLKTTAD